MKIIGWIVFALVLYVVIALFAGPILAIPCVVIAIIHALDKDCRC